MHVGRRAWWLVVGLLVVAAAPVAGGAPSAASSATDAQLSQPQVDNTVTTITVAEDGSATWTVAVRTRLETDQDVSDYEAFQQRFRENTSQFLAPFRDRIERVVARAANATGRDMAARNFSASTSIQELPRRWGVVTYEFTWEGFAATEGDTVVVGDVFEGGYYLAADDLLELRTPPGYRLATVQPEPDARQNDTVRWTGPFDFDDERPQVEYAPSRTESPTATTARAATGGDSGRSVLPWLGAAVGVALAVAAGVVLYGRRNGDAAGGAVAGESDGGDASGGTPAGTTEAAAASDPGPVTDEERVRDLLAAEGGRVEQAAVADRLGWSPSKTSRVVSRLADEGTVEKLRIGRKNVLELAEEPGE